MSDNAKLTLVTGNEGKVREFSRLLGIQLAQRKLNLTEIQAIDVAEVARGKAAEAYSQLGSPVLVDDTGIIVGAWNGLPGALTSWFLDTVGCDGILRMMSGFKDRSATVVTALGVAYNDKVEVYTASVSGDLSDTPRGAEGFGYDPIFIPRTGTKTYAEMTEEEKDENSMRKLAADALQESGVLNRL